MSDVLFEIKDAVAVVTLNRPTALNSFTKAMHRELWAVFDKIEADKSIRAMVLTGVGRGFCAGADLSEFDFSEGPKLVERANPLAVINDYFNPTALKLQLLRVPPLLPSTASRQARVRRMRWVATSPSPHLRPALSKRLARLASSPIRVARGSCRSASAWLVRWRCA